MCTHQEGSARRIAGGRLPVAGGVYDCDTGRVQPVALPKP